MSDIKNKFVIADNEIIIGRVVFRRRDPDSGALAEGDDGLRQRLAEGAVADEEGAVQVL